MGLDFLGRELNEGDLVVSKSSGRRSRMRLGIILETGMVYFEKNHIGGSDIIKIFTDREPDMEKKRLELIQARKDDISCREEEKKKKASTRIKRKDFVRFGVYGDADGNNNELYLGKCMYKDRYVDHNKTPHKPLENVWVRISPDTGYDLTESNFTIRLIKGSPWGRSKNRNSGIYRDVKNPLKITKAFQLTLDEVKRCFDRVYSDKDLDYYEKGWLTIIED